MRINLSSLASFPWSAPEESLEKYQGIEDPDHAQKAGFFALISNIDDNMGRLMQKLDEWEMANDTILIFMTDNGSVASSVYGGGMRGGKTSVYEGGSRVPFFIRLPGKIKAGHDIDTLVRHYDLLPTFADLASADVSELNLDGRSLLPLLSDESASWQERMVFFHKGRWGNEKSKHEKHRRNPGADNNKFRTFAVRDPQWRLTVNNDMERDLELHQIVDDRAEKNNVSKQHPEVVASMLKAYGAWWDDSRPLMINEERDIDDKLDGWALYLRQQKAKTPLAEFIIPGVATDLRVVPATKKDKEDE
jgi:arylsulfatase A-like enzyme